MILHAVFFCIRYAVSYRDLEEILFERGVTVDHATLNRRVMKFAPLMADRVQARKRPTAKSWRMDETYIKVEGRWTYLCRAVDRNGQTLDFLLSERRNLAVARRGLQHNPVRRSAPITLQGSLRQNRFAHSLSHDGDSVATVCADKPDPTASIGFEPVGERLVSRQIHDLRIIRIVRRRWCCRSLVLPQP